MTLRRPRPAFAAKALLWAIAIAVGLLPNGLAPAQESREQPQEQVSSAIESAFRRQPELLERALAGLKATRAGQPPQLFFVSFAGWGQEAVFMREALAVRDLFDERFGTEERSLVLINHASTHHEIALASPPNLDAVLRRVGALMRKSEDVLFLFLTSHGKKDLFAVGLPGLPLDDLTPASLKSILERSGIKSRVVVLSACHSGSFIPVLADPNTLVITAAHADRTSFGCEDKRQWTYFGDAYFNRALRRERSFARAFHQAKRTIGRWEASEGLVRSLPQMAGGEALGPLLETLTRRGAAPH